MSTPLTIASIERECRKLDLSDIQIYPNAKNLDRPGTFSPIGVTVHTTMGVFGSEEEYVRWLVKGDPAVPLKCNAAVAPDGTLWFTGQGNANHANYYSSSGKKRTEQGKWPLDRQLADRGSKKGWSKFSYGIEIIAKSGSQVTSRQRHTAIVWAAAICRLHRWATGRIHGHGEISSNREFSDPGIDMGKFRRDSDKLIRSGSFEEVKSQTIDQIVALLP